VTVSAPTPIHRDPDEGDDFGCVGPHAAEANAAVALLVDDVRGHLKAGNFIESSELISFVRVRLERLGNLYDCGSCDTVVKENVFAAFSDIMDEHGPADFDRMGVYGW